jgi:hypothetical protein
MKIGRSLTSLAAEVERITNTAKDYVADTRKLSMSDDGSSILLDVMEKTEKLGINDYSHDQIGAKLGIPAAYYDIMREKAPALLARNVNHWFTSSPENRLLRTVDGRVRAFLSDRYRPLDNFDLMQAVLPSILAAGCKVESCELTETRLYIKAVSQKIMAKVVGDVVQAGLVVSNSEVGAGSCKVEPLVWTLRCANGMIAEDYSMRKYHVGKGKNGQHDADGSVSGAREFFRDETIQADDKAFWLKVRDTVDGTLNESKFQAIVDKLNGATRVKIDADPVKVVERVAKKFSWSEGEQGSVLNQLVAGGDMTQYGLLNAITAASQVLPNYDRATEFERQGGAVLNMTGEVWNGLVAI